MTAQEFKTENRGKFVWYNGAMGLDTALANDYIEDTYEDAVNEMAWRDGVSREEVMNNYRDWYYIMPVEEIEDDALEEYFNRK